MLRSSRWTQRWTGVGALVLLAGCLLTGLGLAKLATVVHGESGAPGVTGAQAGQLQNRVLVQGIGETIVGLAIVLLPAPWNSVTLTIAGAGFLVGQVLWPSSLGPCPCLAGVETWAAWIRDYKAEWRMTLATWFFLVGALSWRSAWRKEG